MLMVDDALEHACSEFRARAACGEITAAERDLLIDGAIMLAVHIEELVQDARSGRPVSWPDVWRPSVLAGGPHG